MCSTCFLLEIAQGEAVETVISMPWASYSLSIKYTFVQPLAGLLFITEWSARQSSCIYFFPSFSFIYWEGAMHELDLLGIAMVVKHIREYGSTLYIGLTAFQILIQRLQERTYPFKKYIYMWGVETG